jgi:hypothetical protein
VTKIRSACRRLDAPPHLAKLNQWFLKRLEFYRDQGVADEFLKDPIVQTLIYEVSLRKHYREIQADPIFFEAAFLELFKLVSPYVLRELATAAFGRGDYEIAEDLDWLAGLREAAEFRPAADKHTPRWPP